ncbi:MAG: FHA domain-containing protein [Bifidobacteriaceae bacterium]|jgi:pSer/pThr/pTyr-binding forkhead associated (FHA) protein|nr:FHA domain-containing protein [Bifidobacteriaceae bacterium]
MIDIIIGVSRYVYLLLLWIFVIVVAVRLKKQISNKPKKALDNGGIEYKGSRGEKEFILEVIDEEGNVFQAPIEQTDITIGRSEDNSIVLKDNFISAKHLKVLRDGKKVYVEDLSSTNGTFINGKQIFGINEVKPEKIVNLGNSTLEIKLG